MASDSPRSGSLSSRLTASTRVLVIEDDADIAEFLRAYFRASGYDFVHVDPIDADAGLAAILEHRPQCVLLDIGLRGFSGLDIYRQARATAALALTPVVVMTADATVRPRTDAAAAGIDGFVEKPFNANSLAGVVEQRIDAARRLGASGVIHEGSEVLTAAVLAARLADEVDVARASGQPLTFGLVTLRSMRDLRRNLGEETLLWLVGELVGEASDRLPRELTLARTATGELAVLAPGWNPPDAARLLEPALGTLRGKRSLPGGATIAIEPAGGLAGFPEHAFDPDELFMAADTALGEAIASKRLLAIAL